MNGVVKVYSSVWRKELFVAVLSLALAVFLLFVDRQRMPVALFLSLTGLFALYTMFRERLTNRPYLTITDENIVIRREWHDDITVSFREIKSFERETLTIFNHTTFTGSIIVHLVNGHGFVHIISADGLAIGQQELFDLLNERLNGSR